MKMLDSKLTSLLPGIITGFSLFTEWTEYRHKKFTLNEM